MLYHNPITDEFYSSGPLKIGDTIVFSPSEETLALAGYYPYTEPATSSAPSLELAIAEKLAEIEAYDTSDAVNSFSIGEHSGWINKNDRAAFNQSLSRYISNGRETCELWLGEAPISIPCELAVSMLGALCDYADECFLVTHRHIAQVRAMTDIEAVLGFDITADYPSKLVFTL